MTKKALRRETRVLALVVKIKVRRLLSATNDSITIAKRTIA
jgi:hypothetical protein